MLIFRVRIAGCAALNIEHFGAGRGNNFEDGIACVCAFILRFAFQCSHAGELLCHISVRRCTQ